MFLFSPCNIQYRLFFLVIEQILVKFPVSVLLISICIKMPPVCIFFYSFFVFFFFVFFLHTLYFEFDLLLLGFWEKIPLMYPVIFSDTLRHTDTQILCSPHQPSGGAPGYSSHTHTCKHTPM